MMNSYYDGGQQALQRIPVINFFFFHKLFINLSKDYYIFFLLKFSYHPGASGNQYFAPVHKIQVKVLVTQKYILLFVLYSKHKGLHTARCTIASYQPNRKVQFLQNLDIIYILSNVRNLIQNFLLISKYVCPRQLRNSTQKALKVTFYLQRYSHCFEHNKIRLTNRYTKGILPFSSLHGCII